MSETPKIRPKRMSVAKFEAITNQQLSEMRHLQTLMQADRIEIDRLQRETQILREESVRLEIETRATLSRLKAMFA